MRARVRVRRPTRGWRPRAGFAAPFRGEGGAGKAQSSHVTRARAAQVRLARRNGRGQQGGYAPKPYRRYGKGKPGCALCARRLSVSLQGHLGDTQHPDPAALIHHQQHRLPLRRGALPPRNVDDTLPIPEPTSTAPGAPSPLRPSAAQKHARRDAIRAHTGALTCLCCRAARPGAVVRSVSVFLAPRERLEGARDKAHERPALAALGAAARRRVAGDAAQVARAVLCGRARHALTFRACTFRARWAVTRCGCAEAHAHAMPMGARGLYRARDTFMASSAREREGGRDGDSGWAHRNAKAARSRAE